MRRPGVHRHDAKIQFISSYQGTADYRHKPSGLRIQVRCGEQNDTHASLYPAMLRDKMRALGMPG